MGENKRDNLIDKTCDELKIKRKDLAEILNIPIGTINRWASNEDTMPEVAKKALAFYMELQKKNEDLKTVIKAFEIIKDFKFE